MTPRPPTHREPTDEEMQCLPEGTLFWADLPLRWIPSIQLGESQLKRKKHLYAIPITGQEVKQDKCIRCFKGITEQSKSEVGLIFKEKTHPLCLECGDFIWSQRANTSTQPPC